MEHDMNRLLFPLIMMLIPKLMPRLIPKAFLYLRLSWKLTFDRRVNLLVRSLIPLALIYFVWPWRPFNLVPDQLAYLGKLDDAVVLGLSLLLLIKLSPKHIVEEHMGTGPKTNRPEDTNPSNVVDGSAKFIDEE
tara:strand:+ start:100 stop:501 length:402 start_codon:yes stop_codon:yes gene_type:complete